MEHGLTGIFAAVGHNAVAGCDALFFRDLGSHFIDVPYDCGIFRRDLCGTADVLLRDQQLVIGSDRVNIFEHIHSVIFIDLCARDLSRNDLTKQAIFHE